MGVLRHAALLAAGMVTATQPVAAQDGRWLGLDLPQFDIAAPAALYQNADLPHLSIEPAEDRPGSRGISGAELMQTVHEIVAISESSRLSGAPLWGRMSGREGEREVVRYMVEAFEAAGLHNVHTERYPIPPQWRPLDWSVTLEASDEYGEGTTDFVLQSAFPSQVDRDEGGSVALTGEAVFIGLGSAADIRGRDLNDKIAVFRYFPTVGATHTARGVIQRAAEAGAVATIAIYNLPVDVITEMGFTGPIPIPNFTVTDSEGRFIEQVIARAPEGSPLEISIYLTTAVDDGLYSENVIGELPGRTDERVGVLAHHDAYFWGANDNASGMAMMLGIARHLAARPTQPRRTHVFIATGGHHARFAGQRDFLVRHADELEGTVLTLNAEHPAAVDTTVWQNLEGGFDFGNSSGVHATNSTAINIFGIQPFNQALFDSISAGIARYGMPVESDYWRAVGGDTGLFGMRGYLSAGLTNVGEWYHTTADIAASVSEPGLERATRLYIDVLDDVEGLDADALE